MNDKLKAELDIFQDLWEGGYYEGDPLNPMAKSGYGQLGFISTLHATYLRCIKPYINRHTISLEIGPGRGAWTKALLPSKEIYALDALPEEHNRFFEYLGYPQNVKYIEVKNFKCEILPDNYFDYMFSYGCLCHVSFEGITEYAKNLYPKLKEKSTCFWMVADYDKHNNAILNLSNLSIWSALIPKKRRYLPLRWFSSHLMKRDKLNMIPADVNDEPKRGGRWYDAGIKRTCSMLEGFGYHIVDPDVGTCLRDPIIHFIKP
jgi:hypothetical protein